MKAKVIILGACVTLIAACKVTNDCSCKKAPYIPADLVDVRCDTYNDVRTIFYSYIQFCDNYPAHNPKCDTIRVTGWVSCNYDDYMLLEPELTKKYQQYLFSASLGNNIYIKYPNNSIKYESGYYSIIGTYGYRGGCFINQDLLIFPIVMTKMED